MNFKNISIIISLLSLNLKVFSVPLNEEDLNSNLNDNYDTPENVVSNSNISEGEIYTTLPVDDVDVDDVDVDDVDAVIEVTDAIVEDETDSASDDEVTTVPAIETDECTSDECIEMSKRILSSLDTSVNPCDDFYEFSCGGWMAMNNDKDNYSIFREIGDKVVVDLRDILENDYKTNKNLNQKEKEIDELLFNKMKNIYTQCLNNYKDNNDKELLMKFIKNFNINETLSKHDGLTSLLIDLHNSGVEIFFDMGPEFSIGHSYLFIPIIKDTSLKYFNNLNSAFLEMELSNQDLSVLGNFIDENEYNTYLQQQKDIIDNFQEYIRKTLQIIYDSDENKIDKMIESVVEVEKLLSHLLIDAKYVYAKPIYSTEPTDNVNDIELETMVYNNDYDNDMNYNDFYENYDNFNIDDLFNNNNNNVSIKTLNEKYPLINWKLYFEKRFELYGIEVSISEESIVDEELEFKYTYEFLKEINKNDLANYIEWKIIEKMVENILFSQNNGMFENVIFEEFIQIKNQYKIAIGNEYEKIEIKNNNQNTFKEKSKNQYFDVFKGDDVNTKCLNMINVIMPLPLSKYYSEMKFNENIKSVAINMIENIREAMMNRIQEIEWLDESTRKYAIEKVSKMNYDIGYSDLILNPENIYNYYKPLINVHDDYLSIITGYSNNYKRMENIVIYNEDLKNIENLEIEVIDYLKNSIITLLDDLLPTYIVNAVYSRENNKMEFSTSILQKPNFSINQPDYINYGVLGSIMGHELTHAFDDSGKLYDAYGKENNWWTDNDNEEFNEYSQCFIDQYGNYSYDIKGKKNYVDGKLTLGENLADNSGVERSFEAWKMSIENNPEEAVQRNMKLPGLSHYTMEQLFYISFAQFYCEKNVENEDFLDPHSPGKFRVIGSLTNNKRFAKTFNCPAKTPMNPDHKCILW